MSGSSVLTAKEYAALPLSKAADLWLEARSVGLRTGTLKLYRSFIRQLNRFFGDRRVRDIHIGHILAYQKARVHNIDRAWESTAGPSCINHELSVLQMVMKQAEVWGQVGSLYSALPLPAHQPKKVLSEVEERRLFAVASTRPDWELPLLVAKVTTNTTAAGTELRHLRRKDIILDSNAPRIIICGDTAKNDFRGRVIALNETARKALLRCLDRAESLGSVDPEHFVFPYRVKTGLYDPRRATSASWLNKSFAAVREAAGLPWLTPHCFRHQAVTRMLENGAAPETVRHIAGHVSEQMMRHYSHSRLDPSKGSKRA